MGQKISSAGKCNYCNSQLKTVQYKGLYPSPDDDEILEIHCNTCRASWNPDGTPRAIPSEARLAELNVLQECIENGLPISSKDGGEWYKDYTEGTENTEGGEINILN